MAARILRDITRAVFELFPHPNLLHVYKMVVDDDYWNQMLQKCKHPLRLKFYRQYFVNTNTKDRIKTFSHPLNKVEELMEEALREFFCQSKSLSFRKLMDGQKVVFCRVPTSYLETRQARVLGSFILMKLKIEAVRRKERKKQVWIIVDEYHNFTDAIDVKSTLAESRKYGTNYIMTTQNLQQLRDEQRRVYYDRVVLGNVSHIFAFRMTALDVTQIAESSRRGRCGACRTRSPRPSKSLIQSRNTARPRNSHHSSKRERSPENQLPEPRFSLGRTVATPGALDALETNTQNSVEFLLKHAQGDGVRRQRTE